MHRGARICARRRRSLGREARSLIEVVRLSVYLPRNARALMRARQLGGQIKYLSQGEIEARNRGYSPYSVETWRTWNYWANKAGCGHLLTRPNGMRTRQKADPQNGRFPLSANVAVRTDLCPLEPTSRPRREAVPASEFRPGRTKNNVTAHP
jgi:hypothetical protein